MATRVRLIALGGCFGAPAIYRDMFKETLTIYQEKDLHKIKKGDVILYGGGEDISPSLYGEKPFHSHSSDLPSPRDVVERLAFLHGQEVGAKHYGICRGAQLLCALSGAKLVQHVSNHTGGNHFISTNEGKEYVSSSVHHQMMWPYVLPKDKFELIATASENRSSIYMFNELNVKSKIEVPEPEIVYFRETNSLGIQGHPEFMVESAPFVQYSIALVQKYLLS